ncbi:MAG: glycoside hydrolase family 3 protein [Rhodothermia bacterium]|nr:MAG: glycoside hydrolase family 3 protein [Rhodothermia bacterium]
MYPESLYEKAAQLLFPRIGSNMQPSLSVEDDAARVERLLESCAVGGLVLFNGNLDQTPDTLARLQSKSRFPLLIGTDMERGVGQQLAGATVFPHAFAFDALGDKSLAALKRSTSIASREALTCGIHISFSPVADVHSNPDNPIISIRAFGSGAESVSDRVRTYVRVCQEKGLLSTAKHFPGHGDTSTDSHEQIPVVEKSREELQELELLPFQAAIDEGVDLVMTAHVAYPALDPSGTVATQSEPILTQLLRNELGFKGVVVTDSLLMEAASSKEDGAVWAAKMLSAGVDILLDVADPETTVQNLVQAVENGLLTEKRIDESVSRIWALRTRLLERYGGDFFLNPSNAGKRSLVGCADHERVAREIADHAVRILTGSAEAVSGSRDSLDRDGLFVLLVRPHVTYSDSTAASLEGFVRTAFKNVEFEEILPDTSPEHLADLVNKADQFGSVLIAAVVKPAAWHRFGLLPAQKQFIHSVAERCRVILAALGSPRVLDDFPDVQLGICTYSDVAVSNQALVSYVESLFASNVHASGD